VLKLLVVSLTGSVSVLAETINSAGDLLGSAVAYGSVRAAGRPPDESHEYGHGKFENLSGVVIALLVAGGGAYAFNEAIQHLARHTNVVNTTPAIVVMAVSGVVNLLVSQRLLFVGNATDSMALCADGKHLQSDVVTSFGAMIGLFLTGLTRKYWIDPSVALVITILIFWIAMQIARDAVMMLSDASLPHKEEQMLREALESDPHVLGYHKLRTRKSGSHRHVDVHVQIDDRLSFVEAHQYTEDIEDKLRATLRNLHPIIHAEPFEAEIRHQMEAHLSPPTPNAADEV